MSKRGFTLIELLVVIAIIAILASILFPVFTKARDKARQTQCTNNVRQLALAVQMYVQDNNSRYPGVSTSTFTGWDSAIENYVGSSKLFACPSDAANDIQTPNSYGYNGLLVGPGGQGAIESQVLFPTEVGVICDATPTRDFNSGGLVGGGALSTSLEATVNPAPRHGGVIIGYCDGHAKIAAGKKFDPKDISNGVSRAFYQATGLGLLENWAGGIENTTDTSFASLGISSSDQIFIGGDSAGSQILLAACDIFSAKGGRVLNRGFVGYDANGQFKRASAGTPKRYAWIGASGENESALNGATSATIIGYDAMVFIVSKNCKITKITSNDYTVTSADLKAIFDEGSTANSVQCYTFPEYSSGIKVGSYKSGSRKYFLKKVCNMPWADDAEAAASSDLIDANATSMDTDQEIVDGVAGDAYGIGYCSASVADPDRVRILKYNNGTKTFSYPNQNPKYASVVPDPMPDLATEVNVDYYSFVRPIYLYSSGFNTPADKLGKILSNLDFQEGPLFKTSFWAP